MIHRFQISIEKLESTTEVSEEQIYYLEMQVNELSYYLDQK